MKKLCTVALAGNALSARTISQQIAQLNRLLFQQANPLPVKWALAQLGRAPGTDRLPLTELMMAYHAELDEAMQLVDA